MAMPKEHFVVDEKGNKVSVVLDIDEYRRIVAELEELESIRAYDAAKGSGEEAIPLEDAIADIERKRK
ncbi:MAG: hypothetical protein ACLGHO_05275 [Gammaproteobacteria bacterium]